MNQQQQQQQDEEFSIEDVFESAVAIVRNLPKEGSIKPSDELKLKLYAYFKQATYGPNDTPKPKFYQFVEAYKWDAWRKLGDMPKEEAMSHYIAELKQIMDTIPQDDSMAEDNKHFEDILGKKFYDYWFDEWNNQKSRELTSSLIRGSHLLDSISSGSGRLGGSTSSQRMNMKPTSSTAATTTVGATTTTGANDTHSNSSDNSSMSMLEEAQSPDGDGYKTPNSLQQCNITGQMSDQFALAVLRLQHGLDETNTRLNRIENQLAQSIDSIRSLENQTFAKRPATGGSDGACECQGRSTSSTTRKNRSRCGGNKLIQFVSRIDSLHWFYLSYPIVVYALFKAYERRKKSRSIV